jgi:hypothetical protein
MLCWLILTPSDLCVAVVHALQVPPRLAVFSAQGAAAAAVSMLCRLVLTLGVLRIPLVNMLQVPPWQQSQLAVLPQQQSAH